MLLIVSIACAAYLVLLGVKSILAVVRSVDGVDTAPIVVEPGMLTIMQPILSGDVRLEEMLEGNLVSLPGQRFLWLCDEWDVEAIRVATRLKEKHPASLITIQLCADCPEGINPKVFKLIAGTPEVVTPFIAVLDDDTHLPAETAADLVKYAQSATVTTALPAYRNDGNFSGRLLSQFVDNNSVMTYLPLLHFCPPISINGMCYVMKSGDLGLFGAIRHHLTDDLALAGAVRSAGGTIYQSVFPVRLTTDITDFRHYLRMMHRWYLFALLLLRGQPAAYKGVILLLHGWHPLVLWIAAVGLLVRPSLAMAGVVGGFLLIRSCVLGMLQGKVFGRSQHLPISSVVSEMLQPFHLLHAALDRNIRWRSRRYRVHSSEHFEAHE